MDDTDNTHRIAQIIIDAFKALQKHRAADAVFAAYPAVAILDQRERQFPDRDPWEWTGQANRDIGFARLRGFGVTGSLYAFIEMCREIKADLLSPDVFGRFIDKDFFPTLHALPIEEQRKLLRLSDREVEHRYGDGPAPIAGQKARKSVAAPASRAVDAQNHVSVSTTDDGLIRLLVNGAEAVMSQSMAKSLSRSILKVAVG